MPKEEIGPVNRREIDLAVTRCREFLLALENFQKWFHDNPDVDELYLWRFSSLNLGLQRLEALPREFTRTVHASSIGKPLGPTSSKARKPSQMPSFQEAKARAKKAAKKKNAD
jgi:hypothetical protein